MSRFDDRFEEHGIHAQLEEILTAVGTELDTVEAPDQLEELQRLRDVTAHIERLLANTEPHLVSPITLNSVNQHLAKISVELTHYRNNRGLAHLQNANTHADQAVHTAGLIASIPTQTVESVKDDIVSYRRSAGQLLRHLQDDVTALRSEIAALDTQLEAERSRIDSQTDRLDVAVANFQQQFSEAEDRRRERFDAVTAERAEKFAAQLQALTDEAGAAVKDLEQSGGGVIDELERLRDQAAELVGVIGNTGKAGQYQQQAVDERKAADLWRAVAVGAMVGIVVTALSLIFFPTTGGWPAWATRLFLSVAFGVLATYAARESAQHRKSERRARKLALELAALNPYLALLPEASQNEVKLRLAERFFGQPEESESDDPYSALPLVQLLDKALDKIPGR